MSGLARTIGSLALLALVSVAASAEYPRIARLDRSDPLYVQLQDDVQRFYVASSAGKPLPPLLIYSYEMHDTDTLFAVAARLSLPYGSIATLNRISEPTVDSLRTLLIPGVPGIFVPLAPASDLERIMADLRKDRASSVVTVTIDNLGVPFRFYPGDDYLPDERTAFLGLIFRRPLPDAVVSSPYGPRLSPITHQYGFHAGTDYAAPAGTSVLAARGGRVIETGTDEILGNYVILEHSGGFQTVYGHLATVVVSLNDEVGSGMILGTVGSTGEATGPHLHFEIRQGGRTRDPEQMLP